ncbi:MAG: MMPL family transporter [Sporichthyaceae bacterium]
MSQVGEFVEKLAHFVLRHRRLIVVAWLLAMVFGGFAASKATERLTVDFSLPGQQGYETSKKILDLYGNGGPTGNPPEIVVVTAPEGQDITTRLEEVRGVMAKIVAELPQSRIVDYSSYPDPALMTADRRTAWGFVYGKEFESFADTLPSQAISPILKAENENSDLDWHVTGYNTLAQGSSEETEQPSLLMDTLFAGGGALIVLLILFASFLAFVPLLIAAVAILNTFTLLWITTYLMDVSFVVQFLVGLIGLGVAVDYSLLLVTRWREERHQGRDNHDAVVVSMKHAGHAVAASAGTVAISLCALLVIPVPLLQSMGIGGMMIPIMSTLVVLTLLPALLGGIGPRVDFPRIRKEGKPSRFWSAWGRGVVRHRWISAGVAGAIVTALFVPIFGMNIGMARTESLTAGGPAYDALTRLKDGGVANGVVSPMEILVQGPNAAASAQQVVDAVKAVPGVASVLAPDLPTWRKGDAILVDVIPKNETVDSHEAGVVDDVLAAVSGIPEVQGISGTGPTIQDYLEAVYGNFPLTLALISIVTFLLLVRTFRSILLPLKAVLLNIVSVGATFGATVLFWQKGYGSDEIFGIEATGAVTFWVPLMIFAFLFGLSMDYEVFILSRMREEYDRTGDTNAAVVEGLARTGRLVTGAALILFLSFIALAGSPGTEIKVLATALGVGILLDATVVRALLVPALVSLFGKWNWWMPAWVATVLFIKEPVATPHLIPAQSHGPVEASPLSTVPHQMPPRADDGDSMPSKYSL